MNIDDVTEISICTDCMMWHANGDTEGLDDVEIITASPGDGWIVSPGHLHTVEQCGQDVYDGTADCPYDEGSFSMSPCDACKRPLGGDRYPASMFRIDAQ